MDFLTLFGITPLSRAYIRIEWVIYEGAYHFFVERTARRNGLKGWMRVTKQPMGEYIEMEVEGRHGKILKMLEDLKEGPATAHPSKAEVQWKTYKGLYRDFSLKV